jgi:hypothetical protein
LHRERTHVNNWHASRAGPQAFELYDGNGRAGNQDFCMT